MNIELPTKSEELEKKCAQFMFLIGYGALARTVIFA
jgi:hypothetical protein